MRGRGGGGRDGRGEEGEVGFHIQKSLLSPSTIYIELIIKTARMLKEKGDERNMKEGGCF